MACRWQSPVWLPRAGACRLVPAGCLQLCSVSNLGEGEFRTRIFLCNPVLPESSRLCQMMKLVITLCTAAASGRRIHSFFFATWWHFKRYMYFYINTDADKTHKYVQGRGAHIRPKFSVFFLSCYLGHWGTLSHPSVYYIMCCIMQEQAFVVSCFLN